MIAKLKIEKTKKATHKLTLAVEISDAMLGDKDLDIGELSKIIGDMFKQQSEIAVIQKFLELSRKKK